MRRIKKHVTTILLVLILLTGVSLLLYPTISDYWNSFHQSRAIASYVKSVAEIDHTDYEKMWQEAVAYNEKLKENSGRWALTDEELKKYDQLLNISDTGIMGYIEIPKINVSLPIYHGTDEAILQIAVGHIPGSSFPVGGKGTHCVVSGHRGLPSAKLFTDLDQMEEGDLFMIRILDETLTYEVDQMRTVEPEELSDLEIDEDRDLCTLVTCTPYGINSHRLLVRGHRVENQEEGTVHITADAQQTDPVMVAPAVAVPLILLLGIGAWLIGRRRR